jgi:transketolase
MAGLSAGGASIATRKASQNAIDALHGLLPELLGGSADLTGSNLTAAQASTPVRGDRWGDYINYGVREFGMSAAMNGIALHGGYIPFGGTFLTFSDYSRNAIRMSALMQLCVVYVFTHDSIGLGEDGPTHQPIEHVSSLRLIPNNDVWRPCDDLETLAAWLSAVERSDGPTCLILSRQNLPHCQRTPQQVEDIRKGGYVLAESDGAVVTLLATGSEVSLAMQARAALADLGLFARVVSMPSCREFDRQSLAYRSGVLPRNIPVLAIEAGVTNFWRAYVGLDGEVIGIDRFGESAPAQHVAQELGLTVNAVVDRAQVLALRGSSC